MNMENHKKKYSRIYELYCNEYGKITNQVKNYRKSDFIIQVKAKSIKQAYFLVSKEIYYSEVTKTGITYISWDYDSLIRNEH